MLFRGEEIKSIRAERVRKTDRWRVRFIIVFFRPTHTHDACRLGTDVTYNTTQQSLLLYAFVLRIKKSATGTPASLWCTHVEIKKNTRA